MRTNRLALSQVLFFSALVLVITTTSACAAAFVPPPGFSLKGTWEGTFTNPRGEVFPQTMIIEEHNDSEFRGRYIAVRGERELRGKAKLPELTLETFDALVTLRLSSENTIWGETPGNPHATPPIPPGQLYFKRKQ